MQSRFYFNVHEQAHVDTKLKTSKPEINKKINLRPKYKVNIFLYKDKVCKNI